MINYKDKREQDSLYKRYKTLDNYMLTLKNTLEEIKDEKFKQDILILSGFGESKAYDPVDINGLSIDKNLAYIIRFCVNNDIPTIASCSGLASDHIYDTDREGYIAFKDEEKSRKFIEMVWDESWSEPELGYTHFTPSIRISINHTIINKINKKIKKI